jgi:hypothetical protein
MSLRLSGLLLALMASSGAAFAAEKSAIFPFELDYQPSEEDFYIGEKKVTGEEAARLKAVHAEFVRLLGADGRFQPVDLTALAADITAAQPIHSCNDCDIDLAKKAGADLAFTTVIDKISETHLNMIVTVRDVATGAVARNHQAVIQGNTDDTWMHAARWIVKNRLLAESKGK